MSVTVSGLQDTVLGFATSVPDTNNILDSNNMSIDMTSGQIVVNEDPIMLPPK